MGGILGLFAFGIVVVIITQFVKAGSSGPTVIKNIFAGTVQYLNLLK